MRISAKKRDVTLDKLRIATQEMILDKTWGDVSVQDISRHAKVSIGTFYNYFDSKDAALLDVRTVLSDVLIRDLDALLATQDDIHKRLTLFFKYFIYLVEAKPKWAAYLYGGECFDERLKGGIKKQLVPILVEGIAKQDFQVDDIDITSYFIESGLFSIIKNSYLVYHSITHEMACKITHTCLTCVGVNQYKLQDLLTMPCPFTPLSSLPISTLAMKMNDMHYA